MSGVQAGSRIEQLERLLVRVQQELATERLKARTDPIDPRGGVRTMPEISIAARIEEAKQPEVRVGALAIKRWAFERGLASSIPRGRVRPDLLQAYEAEHGVRVVLEAAR